ncbi:RRM domain-containing protein [Haematococcus lacustris]|uniref:RRM domain-containing protein n=1 Tax=Haematococcus lacustris TaxID=44745 RepID=A0A6A0AI03_HAELA|nr:RRM domain-containing protein [Haematococcus lacustris]
MSYPDPYMGAPMRDEPPGTEGQTQCKAFVGGLSYQINHEDLRKAFERYDAVSAEVMMDRHTGRPRGFGFVYFKDEQGLKDAVEQMHEKELEGRRISVTRAVPQDQTKPGTPAAILGGGSGARRDWGRRDYGRDERPPARGYDRGYGGGYERGGGYGGGGYDPRYAYDRGGYDRGYGGNGGYGGYDRRADPYADPYGRSGGAYGGYGGGYGGHYDDRAGYGAYDYGRPAAYEDRGAGGPDRRGYAAPRSGPYDRPPERRVSEPPRR